MRTTCQQQTESRRGSSGRAKSTGGRQGWLPKHHEDSRTKLVSSWNPAISTMQQKVPETRKTGQEIGRRPQHLLATRQDLTEKTTISRTTQTGSLRRRAARNFIGSRLKQSARTTPNHHDYDNPTNGPRTNNKYDSGSRPKRRRR